MPQTFENAKTQICEDMIDNVIPVAVKSFSELHDYVDANEYLLADGEQFDIANVDEFNKLSDSLDKWLKTRDECSKAECVN